MTFKKQKTTNLLVLLFLCFLNSNAQIAQIGIKGGLNYSDFQTDNFDTKAITSYHIGATVNFKLIKGVAAQGELLYSTVGGKYKKPIDEVFQEYKNELGYISIPLSLQVNIRENIYIEAGPQFSFLLKNKNNFNFDNEETYDLGYFGGIGFHLFKKINVGARYVGGTKNVYQDVKSKTNLLQVYIEVKI